MESNKSGEGNVVSPRSGEKKKREHIGSIVYVFDRCRTSDAAAISLATAPTTTRKMPFVSTTASAENDVTSTTSSHGSVLDDTTRKMSLLDDVQTLITWNVKCYLFM